jgi:hypothetical protein
MLMDIMLGDGFAESFAQAMAVGVSEMAEVAVGPGKDLVRRLVRTKDGEVKFIFGGLKHPLAGVDAVWQVVVAKVVEAAGERQTPSLNAQGRQRHN